MISKKEETPKVAAEVDDDESDDWDKRIFSTGCAVEQDKLNECYWAKKDWRSCKKEMERFRECWKRQGNDQRTQTKDA
ncbi:hypothetical protein ASPSYDRAFT_89478 [Aspergillus sydowii CBS 593.65]|uniref:CHCH domain-containing protein n=1 Tax=Aspergillus sydowii CBS 593.65 TaxID=1036612 RepID=A0A1L9THG2_9EURO|nr:uncharacterized protein ASPSYDRAFT_89478 [Aspergillus sydowii CBS 593.65]OJJ58743.1 hypothetical protein ASPSYDRAFT_89478 [Aspergillus sydowii CBS 593.65]